MKYSTKKIDFSEKGIQNFMRKMLIFPLPNNQRCPSCKLLLSQLTYCCEAEAHLFHFHKIPLFFPFSNVCCQKCTAKGCKASLLRYKHGIKIHQNMQYCSVSIQMALTAWPPDVTAHPPHAATASHTSFWVNAQRILSRQKTSLELYLFMCIHFANILRTICVCHTA